MIKIGITGGIGSGKTTVAQLFSIMGIAIYNSDIEGKQLMHNSPSVVKKIKHLFGETAYRKETLNSEYISQIVFRNPNMLYLLNNIVHPAVIEDFQKWANIQKCTLIGIESAILFESGISHCLDYTIGIVAPLETRINRVITRSKLSKEEIQARINRQISEESLKERCDFIVENNNRLSIIEQVVRIADQINKKN